MPFFSTIHVCYIHIPKTGGTSLENYFSKIDGKPLGFTTLYHRHSTKLTQELEQLKDGWKKKVNQLIDKEMTTLARHRSKTDKQSDNRIEHIQSRLKETMETMKQNIVEYKNYRKIQVVKKVGYSLHHFTWNDLCKYKDILIHEKYHRDLFEGTNKWQIIASVRDPYDRILSELFFRRVLNKTSTSNDVTNILKRYLYSSYNYDNHKTPQYKFICNENDEVLPFIKIVKIESLDRDMIDLGFSSFSQMQLKLQNNKKYDKNKYKLLLDTEAIQIINDYYSKDFEIFGYEQLEEPIMQTIDT